MEMVWVWITLGTLVLLNAFTLSVLIKVMKRHRRLDNLPEPSIYIELVDKKYQAYLQEVVTYLNHEYAIPLMVTEVANSRLVDYIVNSFVNDTPVNKCANNIVYIVDELVEKAKEEESEPEV